MAQAKTFPIALHAALEANHNHWRNILDAADALQRNSPVELLAAKDQLLRSRDAVEESGKALSLALHKAAQAAIQAAGTKPTWPAPLHPTLREAATETPHLICDP